MTGFKPACKVVYKGCIHSCADRRKITFCFGEKRQFLVGVDSLAPDVQPGDVEQMAEYSPAKAVISRDSFADDTAMSNAFYILRDRGVELKLV